MAVEPRQCDGARRDDGPIRAGRDWRRTELPQKVSRRARSRGVVGWRYCAGGLMRFPVFAKGRRDRR